MPKKKTIQPVKQVTTTAKDQVEYVPLSDVKLWAENPRKNSGAVSKLAEQIKTHGFRIPIVVWKKDMVIYAGNTRYKAAKKLGMEKNTCSICTI